VLLICSFQCVHEWRKPFVRESNKLDNSSTYPRSRQACLNYENGKYFGQLNAFESAGSTTRICKAGKQPD